MSKKRTEEVTWLDTITITAVALDSVEREDYSRVLLTAMLLVGRPVTKREAIYTLYNELGKKVGTKMYDILGEAFDGLKLGAMPFIEDTLETIPASFVLSTRGIGLASNQIQRRYYRGAP